MNFNILRKGFIKRSSELISIRLKTREPMYFFSDSTRDKIESENKISSETVAQTQAHAESTKPINDSLTLESPEETSRTGGFAKAFEKFSIALEEEDEQAPEISQPKKHSKPFTTLLRYSKFMQMGDPKGKVVIGKVFHVVEDDLYINFGGKFYCVCFRPRKNSQDYVKGARVRLKIHELELSSNFLGSVCDLTLLEADASILGLLSKSDTSAKSAQ